ncbi:grunge isoform j [Citrus sinensis]|nr:grunge isoform j [Citrus sinensis]
MDFVEENNCENILEDAYSEQLLSLETTDMSDDYRDPELLPRIGDEYQVEIPPLLEECDCSVDAKILCGIPHEVLVGLPISIMWIKGEVEDIKLEPVVAPSDPTNVSECTRVTQNISDCHDLKPQVESMGLALDRELSLRESSMLALQPAIQIEMHKKNEGTGYHPVPGSAGEIWSDIDEASFLLGLYIFGKNLFQVVRMPQNEKQKMYIWTKDFYRIETAGVIISFATPCVRGMPKYFIGVGIGRGKQDLTGMALEPLKPNHAVRPEIPTGKAWSMLSPLEIVNFLTGGYRLSKARSNDLFWEAVWPRLLARGWHSEEPKNYGCAAGSKHSLVFLIPGVKKFSRRKLVKGDHYFDSVSDVLSKVAAEPGLLELEIGTDGGDITKEENGWTDETKLDQQDFPGQQRHCYLKPRIPNRGMDGMKFTVVDTSVANEGRMKVRELRNLPVEMRNNPISRSYSEDSDSGTSEESTDESDSSNTMRLFRNEQNGSKPRNIIAPFERNLNRSFPVIVSGLTSAPAVDIPGQKSNIGNGMRPRKRRNAQLNHRLKPENGIYLGPVKKRRRRLNACNRTQTSSTVSGLVGSELKQDEARCCVGNLSFGENISFHADPSQEKLSFTNSTSKGSPVVSGEGTIGSTCSGVEHPYEEPPPRRMIDLNLPVSPETETDEPFLKEGTGIQPDQASRLPNGSNALKDAANMATSEQQPEVNARRHSTRNRPLTTKALEALAFGFLSTKQKRKFGDSFLREPSRRSRARTRFTENLGGSIPDIPAEEKGNDLCNDNGNMFSELPVQVSHSDLTNS